MFKFVSTKNINELFQRAILHNDIQRTKLILAEAMKDPRFNIDQINEEGLTALQFSCFAGNVEIVKILASFGANWKIRDRDGYTLMHASSMSGNGTVTRYLLQLGLKPILKTDDGLMPIDVTDDISIIVILLRAMLDQGYLQEIQDYMMDHPKLKRNIFKELEKVKSIEQEKAEILNEMPYTSRTPERSPASTLEKTAMKKQRNGHRRSTSTFSELSDSIQQLDRLDPTSSQVDMNDNIFTNETYNEKLALGDSGSSLQRESSFSSGSASSCSGKGQFGILRYKTDDRDLKNAYRDTQQYLQNRFPPASNALSVRPKSVSFSVNDFDSNRDEEKRHCSHNRSTLHEERTGNNFMVSRHEPLYENASSARIRAQMSQSEDPNGTHSRSFQKQTPPPLPPRAPTTKLSDRLRLNHISYNTTTINTTRNYEEHYTSDRQLGSETDSGIDVNETTGRMFALSLNDQEPTEQLSDNSDSYSSPIGLYYSGRQNQSVVKQHTLDDFEIPNNLGAAISSQNYEKYKSWNGRTFHEAQMAQGTEQYPITDGLNFNETRNRCDTLARAKSCKATKKNVPSNNCFHTGPVREVSEATYFSLYDFDNQPEIML